MGVLGSTRSIPAVLAAAALFVACSGQAVLASSPLAAAARNDDVALALELITAQADVNLPEADGSTPLLWAVYNASPDLVSALLDAGADPDIANKLGISPLLQASRYGNAAMIRALLGTGASLARAAPDTETPLMAAARSGSAETVTLLLDAGADPNETEPLQQQTALMWAVAEGHFDAARLLLEAGADPDRRSRASELEQRKNADFPTGGFAALHWAARNADEAMVDLLLAHGADIDIRNGDGSTPMMLAIVNDRFDMAASLLAHGANANDGSLFYATVMRDATTDWRARDGTVFRADHPNQLTALDLTRLLLEAGADPNLPVDMQMHNTSMCCDAKADSTAFYRAAIAADVAGLQLMLAHGADPLWRPMPEAPAEDGAEPMPARGNTGKSVLMVAINGGKGVGIAGGPNDLRYGPPQFREPGNRDPFAALSVLLEAGADVQARDPRGETALHVAARALDPDMVKALVAHGADLHASNEDGKSALQLVEAMEPPKPTPGFYFDAPPALPAEIAALLRQLDGADGGSQ